VGISQIARLLLALAVLLGAGAGPALAQSPAETTFWNRVKDSNRASELRAYLEAYPNGAYADQARDRLRVLEPSRRVPPPPAPAGNVLTDPSIIREVQERLYNLNYDIQLVNGQMTQETRKALSDWQGNNQRAVTGELSEDDLEALRNARVPTVWGALAYAAKGASSVVWSRPSRREAASAALNDCHERAGRDPCKVLTAMEGQCGALGFYMATVRRTTYWAAIGIIRPTLGQATDQALEACRQNSKQPSACGIRLTFCADGSHRR